MGNLQATRKGDTIKVEGEVYHTLKDKYDFNDDTYVDKVLLGDYRDLEKAEIAKSFSVYGATMQKIEGTIQVKNGRITGSDFKWEEIK